MTVKVIYTTQLKDALGRGSDCVSLEQPHTLGGLLRQLTETHGDAFRDFIWEQPGTLRKSIIFCVGSEAVESDLELQLRDPCEVTLLSPVSGG